MADERIEICSWDAPFEDQRVLSELSKILPDFVTGARWYRAKARAMQRLTVVDAIPIGPAFVLVFTVEYEDGGCDEYMLPVTAIRSQHAVGNEQPICTVQARDGSEGGFHSALSDARFRQVLLEAVVCNRAFTGRSSELAAQRTKALDADCPGAAQVLDSFVSRAEQSNTSIVYGDRYILKLFRKLEQGINPDIEIGKFLTERGFKNTPALLGEIKYKREHGASAAGILQQFVRNQGDAWSYTLKALDGFFNRATGDPSEFRTGHPLELARHEPPAGVCSLLGEYAESAALLGKRTAQMHAAFEDESAGPDFVPEPFTTGDAEKLYRSMLSQADIAFELLRRKQAVLAGAAAEEGQAVLRMESEVMNRFAGLRDSCISALKIRHHGDYHLGQVLYTGSDFVIIDFEGEPARPLPERRAKALAMRDVAGMLRSFQYAAYSASFATGGGAEPWAEFWAAWAAAVYLKAYLSEADGLRSVPANPEEQRLLLDAFLLQKALYELAYELNNRPDWVRIPLRGILSLIT